MPKSPSRTHTARGKLILTRAAADRHVLYENAVQGVDGQLDMLARMFRQHRGRRLERFREDFCGTAQLACHWVTRSPRFHAWGIDLDGATLDWCRTHRIPRLGSAADRLTLVQADVLTAQIPRTDLIGAFNFSFNVFKDRHTLLAYFRAAHRALAPDGLLVLDEFGGPGSHADATDKRRISDGQAPDGTPLQSYTYIWEQQRYNPLTHDIRCHIHFRFRDGSRLQRAFTYDWRLWTLPELRDALHEAGFPRVDFYLQGWDSRHEEPNGIFRRRTSLPDEWESWFAYVVAEK
jgi:SAM-dependent methyltransferase